MVTKRERLLCIKGMGRNSTCYRIQFQSEHYGIIKGTNDSFRMLDSEPQNLFSSLMYVQVKPHGCERSRDQE
jgi:hypothetical protein